MILFRKGLSKDINGQLFTKDHHYMISTNTESDELYDHRFARRNLNRTGNKRMDFIPNKRKSLSLWMDVYASEDAELCSKLTRVRIYYEPVTPNLEWKIEAAERLESTRWQPMLVNGDLIIETVPDATNVIFVRTVISNQHILDRIYGNPAWSTPKDRDSLTLFVAKLNQERAQKRLKKETSYTDSGLNQSARIFGEEDTERAGPDKKDSVSFSPPASSTFILDSDKHKVDNNNNKRKRSGYGPFTQPNLWLTKHELLKDPPTSPPVADVQKDSPKKQEEWRQWLAHK